MSEARPWRHGDRGIELQVRLTPGSRTETVDGIVTDAAGRSYLAARVRAVPEKGAANTALCRLLAKRLDVPPRRVVVLAGQTARLKTIRIEGDASTIDAALKRLAGGAAAG